MTDTLEHEDKMDDLLVVISTLSKGLFGVDLTKLNPRKMYWCYIDYCSSPQAMHVGFKTVCRVVRFNPIVIVNKGTETKVSLRFTDLSTNEKFAIVIEIYNNEKVEKIGTLVLKYSSEKRCWVKDDRGLCQADRLSIREYFPLS